MLSKWEQSDDLKTCQRLKLKRGGFGKMDNHTIWVTIHGKDMP